MLPLFAKHSDRLAEKLPHGDTKQLQDPVGPQIVTKDGANVTIVVQFAHDGNGYVKACVVP